MPLRGFASWTFWPTCRLVDTTRRVSDRSCLSRLRGRHHHRIIRPGRFGPQRGVCHDGGAALGLPGGRPSRRERARDSACPYRADRHASQGVTVRRKSNTRATDSTRGVAASRGGDRRRGIRGHRWFQASREVAGIRASRGAGGPGDGGFGIGAEGGPARGQSAAAHAHADGRSPGGAFDAPR